MGARPVSAEAEDQYYAAADNIDMAA